MTRQVLFVQGGGEGVHDGWDNKLVESLRRELGPEYDIRYPAMPNEGDPNLATWGAAFEREFVTLADGAFLVAHSVGATILANVLAGRRTKRRFGGVFLVSAPFVGEGGWPSDNSPPMTDLGARLAEGLPVLLYHGDQDATAPIAHLDLYAQAIRQAMVTRLPGRDHQLNNDLSEVADDIHQLERGTRTTAR